MPIPSIRLVRCATHFWTPHAAMIVPRRRGACSPGRVRSSQVCGTLGRSPMPWLRRNNAQRSNCCNASSMRAQRRSNASILPRRSPTVLCGSGKTPPERIRRCRRFIRSSSIECVLPDRRHAFVVAAQLHVHAGVCGEHAAQAGALPGSRAAHFSTRHLHSTGPATVQRGNAFSSRGAQLVSLDIENHVRIACRRR